MQHVFIINPTSGSKNATLNMAQPIESAAAACGISAEIIHTKAPKHATSIAQEYASKGTPVRLYSVGGDGTLNEILAGAYQFSNAQVACIPCGSGNDFIRTFGKAEDFLDIESQIKGSEIEIDLMELDEGICVAIASTGLDAEVAYNIPKYRRIPLLGGTMAYNVSILERLVHPLGKQLRISVDGREFQGKYLIATVCNAGHYGGGYHAAPMASVSDGMLDIILVKKISRLKISSIINKYKNGRHFMHGSIVPDLQDIVSYHRGKQIEIFPVGAERFILNIDGECAPAPSLCAKVMPKAARFVLPEHLAVQQK